MKNHPPIPLLPKAVQVCQSVLQLTWDSKEEELKQAKMRFETLLWGWCNINFNLPIRLPKKVPAISYMKPRELTSWQVKLCWRFGDVTLITCLLATYKIIANKIRQTCNNIHIYIHKYIYIYMYYIYSIYYDCWVLFLIDHTSWWYHGLSKSWGIRRMFRCACKVADLEPTFTGKTGKTTGFNGSAAVWPVIFCDSWNGNTKKFPDLKYHIFDLRNTKHNSLLSSRFFMASCAWKQWYFPSFTMYMFIFQWWKKLPYKPTICH